MKISLPIPNLFNRLQSLLDPIKPTPQLMQTLQIGNRLDAIVLGQPKLGVTHLAINGVVVTVNSGMLQLTPGQGLQLLVADRQDPIKLRILTDLSQPNSISQFLKQALPFQNSSSWLLTNLLYLSQTQHTKSMNFVPREIIALCQKLLRQLPTRKSVSTADGLKKALLKSGAFFEKQLFSCQDPLQQQITLREDFKALRIQLENVLEQFHDESTSPELKTSPIRLPQTPPPLKQTMPTAQGQVEATVLLLEKNADALIIELLAQVKSSLARTQLTQLASLSSENQMIPLWLFELAVKEQARIDLFQIEIEQNRKEIEDPEQSAWSIRMAFDLANLGPLQVIMKCQRSQISVFFLTALPETREKINQDIEHLTQSFKAQGLLLKDVHCVIGNLDRKNNPPSPDGTILNEKA